MPEGTPTLEGTLSLTLVPDGGALPMLVTPRVAGAAAAAGSGGNTTRC